MTASNIPDASNVAPATSTTTTPNGTSDVARIDPINATSDAPPDVISATVPHATFHVCPIDKTPCEVVAMFADRLTDVPPDDLRFATKYRPCHLCREAEDAARRLPKTRLGKHERELLIGANDEGNRDSHVVTSQRMPRAEREARLRAARTLAASGLVSLEWETEMRWNDRFRARDVRVRGAHITSFGERIVARYRRELAENRPIRWDTRVLDALLACRGRPDHLVTVLLSRVRSAEAHYRRVAAADRYPDYWQRQAERLARVADAIEGKGGAT